MSATTTAAIQPFIPPDFLQNFLAQLAVEELKNLELLAGALSRFARPYVPFAIGVLFVILVLATIKAMFGRWGTLGSVLYHIFYFGLLGIIVWFKGWGILLNAYFDLITTILYWFSYWVTGLCIQRFKGRH